MCGDLEDVSLFGSVGRWLCAESRRGDHNSRRFEASADLLLLVLSVALLPFSVGLLVSSSCSKIRERRGSWRMSRLLSL